MQAHNQFWHQPMGHSISASKLSTIVRPALRKIMSGIIFGMIGSTASILIAQTSDFNAGNDTGWTRYSLPNLPGFSGAATFSFPADDSGGKAYKIYAPPTMDDPYGVKNARAGSYRASTKYTGRFSVGVDLLAWNAEWRQEAGLLFYFQDINLGTSDGYSATYSSGYKTMYISLINDEVATTVGQLSDGSIVLDPTHRYRLVASSHDGSTFLFQLFDKAYPTLPWASVIAQDSTYSSGVPGVFTYEQDYPSSTQGAEAVFDNFAASTPAAGSMPATVTDLTPPPGKKSTTIYPNITVSILNRDTSIDINSIKLFMDDSVIPNSALSIEPQVHKPSNPAAYTRDFDGATVSYSLTTILPWGSTHTNKIVFADNTGAWQTNTWTWTSAFPYLFASNSLPVGSLNIRGFESRMVQSDNNNANLPNSLDRARQQLAVPPQIPIDRSAVSVVQMLNWDKTGTPASVPGLCPGSYINIAVDSYAYLELNAGLHRFHISSDDRCGIYSGPILGSANVMTLWENTGSTANTTFEFMVEAAGLYPIRCLWEETGGGAHLNLYSVNKNDESEVLINDPSNPSGAIKAWYPVVCKSSANASGPYTADAKAVNTLNLTNITSADCSPTSTGQMATGGTFVIPIVGTSRFYYIDAPRKTKITNFTVNASTVVIKYDLLQP